MKFKERYPNLFFKISSKIKDYIFDDNELWADDLPIRSGLVVSSFNANWRFGGNGEKNPAEQMSWIESVCFNDLAIVNIKSEYLNVLYEFDGVDLADLENQLIEMLQ